MEYNTYFSMKCMIYGPKYEVILKMMLLYLVEKAWRNTLDLIFLIIRYRPFVFVWLGTLADSFQQLKLDF